MGLKPDGIVGHSLGEVACGYADGCTSHEESVLCAYWRGQRIKEGSIPPGAMAAVGRCCLGLPAPLRPGASVSPWEGQKQGPGDSSPAAILKHSHAASPCPGAFVPGTLTHGRRGRGQCGSHRILS